MAAPGDVIMRFPGGRKVVAQVGRHEILTDQPLDDGGEDAAPAPFALFIASIGACAGFFALTFLQKRGLSTEGLKVTASPHSENGTLVSVGLSVEVPPGFPEKYREAIIRAIDQCSVKRAIVAQPAFVIELKSASTESSASPVP